MRGPVVVIGDCLLDVDLEGDASRLSPEAPVPVVEDPSAYHRPGGAGLAAALAARGGTEVVLITALGEDPAGHRLAELLPVDLVRLPLHGTTVRKVRVRARGQTLLRIDAGCGGPRPADGPAAERAAAALRGAGAILVADYGGGVAGACAGLLRGLTAPIVWDPHPRGAPPPGWCALVTPNEAEAAALCATAFPGPPGPPPDRAARHLVRRLGVAAVAVTLGERGAVLARRDGGCAPIPAPVALAGRDACGAGDAFAAVAAAALAGGAGIEDAVTAAVGEATRFVAEGGAAAFRRPAPGDPVTGAGRLVPPGAPAFEVADAVRAAGGRVVATGGCFDLLHAGHVSLLRRARALGDALIVCLNSDASVRRLKGPTRPVVPERDRVEVVSALACVDAVTVFDEDTPERVVERLRPHVWVKGGDYAGRPLPEAEAVRRAGGEVVILPTLPGYSTTRLIAAARSAA